MKLNGIPNGVLVIGESAFDNYTSLECELIISENVKTIESFTFNNWGKSSKLTLSDKIENIFDEAFAHCKELVGELTLLQSMKRVGQNIANGSYQMKCIWNRFDFPIFFSEEIKYLW